MEILLDLFGHLDQVVTMGTPTKTGWELLRTRSSEIRSLDWKAAPHPSATNLNWRPERRQEILRVMRDAARKIQQTQCRQT